MNAPACWEMDAREAQEAELRAEAETCFGCGEDVPNDDAHRHFSDSDGDDFDYFCDTCRPIADAEDAARELAVVVGGQPDA